MNKNSLKLLIYLPLILSLCQIFFLGQDYLGFSLKYAGFDINIAPSTLIQTISYILILFSFCTAVMSRGRIIPLILNIAFCIWALGILFGVVLDPYSAGYSTLSESLNSLSIDTIKGNIASVYFNFAIWAHVFLLCLILLSSIFVIFKIIFKNRRFKDMDSIKTGKNTPGGGADQKLDIWQSLDKNIDPTD